MKIINSTKIYSLIIGLILSLHSSIAYASGNTFGGENIWTTGKVYVVLAVVLIIFFGIVFFLLHLENRIKKLEK